MMPILAMDEMITVTIKGSVSVAAVDVGLVNSLVADDTSMELSAVAIYSDNTLRDISTLNDNTWSIVDSNGDDNSSLVSNILTFDLAVSSTTSTIDIVSTYDVDMMDTAFSKAAGVREQSDNAAKLLSIEIYPRIASIALGTAQDFNVYAVYQFVGDDNAHSIIDVTSQATIDTLDSSTAGKHSVVASYNGMMDTATIDVAESISSISITADTTNYLSSTDTQHLSYSLQVLATLSNNEVQDITDEVLWTSSDISVARINNMVGKKGELTTDDAGATTITAQLLTSTGVLESTLPITVIRCFDVKYSCNC